MAEDKSTQSNGKPKDIRMEVDGVEIEYPVTFQLKAVLDNSNSDEENQRNISALLGKLNIPNKLIGSKVSSKGTYTSYHYDVTISGKPQLEEMYEAMKQLPGFKFAL